MASDANTLELVKLSHESHPDLKLTDAVFVTCSIPFAFQPMFINGAYLLDGGLLCNYPLDSCIDGGAKKEEILGIQMKFLCEPITIDQNTNILHYSVHLFTTLCRKSRIPRINTITNEVVIKCHPMNMEIISKILKDAEMRSSFIEKGRNFANIYIESAKVVDDV